jgi:hypothetical protein
VSLKKTTIFFKYLYEVLPFWKSKEVGIISKICLTFISFFIGLIMGSLCIVGSIMSFLGFSSLSGVGPLIKAKKAFMNSTELATF